MLYIQADVSHHMVTEGNWCFLWSTQMSGVVNLWSWVSQFPLRGFLQSPPGSIKVQAGVQDHDFVAAPISSLMWLKFESSPFSQKPKDVIWYKAIHLSIKLASHIENLEK